jgi:hypothetical protein
MFIHRESFDDRSGATRHNALAPRSATMFEQWTTGWRQLPGMTLVLMALATIPVPAQAATWYASASNSSTPPSGTGCTLASPCTLSYALGTKVTAGDTVILFSGTYTDTPDLTTPAKHSNLTITAMPSVVSALTLTRGIVKSGTDNRPYFSGYPNSPAQTSGSPVFTIESGVTGVTLSYLRIRGATYPWDDTGPTGVVRINAYPFTLDSSEVWNGGILAMVLVSQGVTISNSHLHDSSHWAPWPFVYQGNQKAYGTPDVHGIAITNYTNSPIATSYAQGIHIVSNTIHDVGGNGIQENSNCYAGQSNHVAYVTIDGNELYNSAKQNWDSKGTSNVIFSNNVSWFGDHSANGNIDYGHVAINSPNDCSWTQMDNWEIVGNVFHGSIRYVGMWNTQDSSSHCSNHHVYNNVMYNNNQNVAFADDPVYKMCGDAQSTFYNNTLVNNQGSTQSGGLETAGSGNNVKNNIFMNNGADGNLSTHCYKCSNTGTPDHNYFFGANGGGTGTGAITACYATGNCPGFANLAANNYKLLSTSPARKVGVTLGSPYNVDLNGITRTAPWDFGAYAFGTLAAPTNLRVIR